MPISKEFTIRREDKPGTLGKQCQAPLRRTLPMHSGVFLPEVCIDYAGDVLSEPLLDREDLG
jgi:hypothetical protein